MKLRIFIAFALFTMLPSTIWASTEFKKGNISNIIASRHDADITIYSLRTKLSEKAPALTNGLSAIDGVEEVFVTKYSVRIKKGSAFSWTEIDPLVVEFFRGINGQPIQLSVKNDTSPPFEALKPVQKDKTSQ